MLKIIKFLLLTGIFDSTSKVDASLKMRGLTVKKSAETNKQKQIKT